jgi:transitional endoplasmic reticulum ATPase
MKKNVSDPYIAWQKYIITHRPTDVLQKLEQLIQDDGGMFKDDPFFHEFRELSLLFRIDILIEWKRYAEALAWLCLETELNPTNVQAIAIKEQLKKQLNFSKDDDHVSVRNTPQKPLFDWGNVAGMRKVKAIIERDILLPFKQWDLYSKFHVTLPNGILFYGPPGCGKTFIVKQIAKMLHFNFIEVSPSTVASTYVHGTQQKIKELFDEAAKERPSILFIDELEAFVPNRTRTDVNFHYQAEVNEFLIQLNKAGENWTIVMGATNHLNMIDDAVKRPGRFDKKIFIGPPDIEARIEAFKSMLKNKPHNITKWLYIGEETENYTFAEIQFIVEETARIVASHKKTLIDLNDIMKVIVSNPPEFTVEKLQQYF